MGEPRITIETNDGINTDVKFEQVYPLRDQTRKIQLTWDSNSYAVELNEKGMPLFSINGYQHRIVKKDFNKPTINLVRRHRKQIDSNGSQTISEQICYILGVKEQTKELYFIISETGYHWEWLHKR